MSRLKLNKHDLSWALPRWFVGFWEEYVFGQPFGKAKLDLKLLVWAFVVVFFCCVFNTFFSFSFFPFQPLRSPEINTSQFIDSKSLNMKSLLVVLCFSKWEDRFCTERNSNNNFIRQWRCENQCVFCSFFFFFLDYTAFKQCHSTVRWNHVICVAWATKLYVTWSRQAVHMKAVDLAAIVPWPTWTGPGPLAVAVHLAVWSGVWRCRGLCLAPDRSSWSTTTPPPAMPLWSHPCQLSPMSPPSSPTYIHRLQSRRRRVWGCRTSADNTWWSHAGISSFGIWNDIITLTIKRRYNG